MIRKEEILEAIAECQGERNPDARTCIKLAAFYTILNNMYGAENVEISDPAPIYSRTGYSEQISYDSGSVFCEAISGLNMDQVIPIIDELMDAVQLISPKLYNATIDRLKRL